MNPIEHIIEFLSENIHELVHEGGGGFISELPEFDLYPYDYLQYAERNLNTYYNSKSKIEKDESLISCVSNLKRALDCQIDCLLFNYNLKSIVDKRNLSLNKKMEFLSKAGIFRSKSIERLISIRNKVEHNYSIPTIDDLEALFDLVTAFTAILNSLIAHSTSIDTEFASFSENNSDDSQNQIIFTINYIKEKSTFIVKMYDKEKKIDTKYHFSFEKDHESFALIFKANYLLHQRLAYSTDELILEKLKQS